MNTGGGILWGMAMIVVGALAIVMPLFSGVAAEMLIGWMVIVGGVAHLVFAFQSGHTGAVVWKALIGLIYLLVGLYLLVYPWGGMVVLTWIIAFFFLIDGVLELVTYFQAPPRAGSGWLLADGIITLLLAVWVWATWPISSFWFLGTVIGISLLISGFSRLMLTRPGPSAI